MTLLRVRLGSATGHCHGSAIMTFPAGFYAQRRVRMLGQLATDCCVVAWVVLWWLVGRATQRTVDAIATPARRLGDAAGQLADQMRVAAEQAGRVPGIGAELRKPFDDLVGSLQGVIGAAEDQVASVERAGLLLGWLVFLIPGGPAAGVATGADPVLPASAGGPAVLGRRR